MKFAMVIVKSDDAIEATSASEREFESMVRWWAELRANVKVVASARLAPRSTARTVSWRDRVPMVTDGPYVEAKESVGGFLVVDVDSEADALEIAKAWPAKAGWLIEVRPVVEV